VCRSSRLRYAKKNVYPPLFSYFYIFIHNYFIWTVLLFLKLKFVDFVVVMAVDNGKSLTAYSGPVFDYYEFELEGLQVILSLFSPFLYLLHPSYRNFNLIFIIQRLNDEEWREKIKEGTPQPPEWVSSYLIPA
jgi:hypothetical protein